MTVQKGSAVIIIFSKDRALQLDACLRSFALQCGDCYAVTVRVICKCSDAGNERQYQILQKEHPGVEFIHEENFQNDLVTALSGFHHVLFVVDDNLFVRPFLMAEIISVLDSEPSAIGFSLRLGRNITKSYPYDDAPQEMPVSRPAGERAVCFRWVGAPYDFGYPLEVSSSVYRISQVLPLISSGEQIKHPNDLEVRLDTSKEIFSDSHADLLSFEQSVAFCAPVNIVQTTYENRAGSEPYLSVKTLQQRFEAGYRIDVMAVEGFTPQSCQLDIPLQFLPPHTNRRERLVNARKFHCFPPGCHFEINSESVLPDNTVHFRGWLVLKKDSTSTKIRAKIYGFRTGGNYPAEVQVRPEVALHFPRCKDVEKNGFLIEAPLHGKWNYVALQYLYGGEWHTFARRLVSGHGYKPQARKYRPWLQGRPLVSVVIPCYNYGKYLEEAVDSVLSQTWRDLEVLVVDDGSTDPETAAILDRLDKPHTRVIRQKNLKLPAARNTGIKAARGKYICCLDADDMLAPTYIEKCLLRLEIAGFDICGSWQRNFGTEESVHRPGDFRFESLMHSNQMINSALFSKQLWKDAGGFDENMVNGYEDWEFWIRLAAGGARATVIPEPLFLYRKHGPSMIDATLEKHNAIVGHIHAKHTLGRKMRFLPPFLRGKSDEKWDAFSKQPRRQPPLSSGISGKKWKNLLGRCVHNDKPVVLLCLPYMVFGGVEKIVSQVSTKLKDQFHYCIITTEKAPAELGDSTAWFESCTSEIYHLPDFLDVPDWAGFIAYLIRTRNVRILRQAGSEYLYGLLPDLKGLFPKLKVIDSIFNEVGHTASNRKFDYLIDRIITETEATKSWLVAHGERPERIQVIPNGIDLSSHRPRQGERSPFDTRGRRFIVGYFGRLSEEKGPDLFVQIAAQLKSESDILFAVAGAGPMELAVRQQVEAEGLEDSLTFLGFCPTKTYLPFCDLLVVPSRCDGRPNVVMEAMAMGVPVVASKVGGMAELVSVGHTGFLCEPGNIAEFAEKISMLARDRALHARLKANTRPYAEKYFDIEKTVSMFRDTLHEIISPAAGL